MQDGSKNGSGSGEFNIVIGQVARVNESASTDTQGRPTGDFNCFIELAGGLKCMAMGCRASQMPVNGLVVAFETELSRSGKMAMVQRWGFVDTKVGKISDVVSAFDSLVIDWRWKRVEAPRSVRTGGVSR